MTTSLSLICAVLVFGGGFAVGMFFAHRGAMRALDSHGRKS